MPVCHEIDSEDETWQGEIDLSVFQQVRDQQEKQRIVAKLEAQNRPKGGGYAEVTGTASSKEGSKGYRESADSGKMDQNDGSDHMCPAPIATQVFRLFPTFA